MAAPKKINNKKYTKIGNQILILDKKNKKLIKYTIDKLFILDYCADLENKTKTISLK